MGDSVPDEAASPADEVDRRAFLERMEAMVKTLPDWARRTVVRPASRALLAIKPAASPALHHRPRFHAPANCRVCDRYSVPFSVLGSISEPSCHSLKEVTTIQSAGAPMAARQVSRYVPP